MIDRLKSLIFGEDPSGASPTSDSPRLAAAALLVEAAMMDGQRDERETARIHLLLKERFGLSAEAAQGLLEQAIRLQAEASQLFPFTKAIVDHFSLDQRRELIEMLWEVAYADGHLHDYEANLVRRIAGLVHVTDQESGAARRRAMAVLGLSDGPLV